MSELLYKASPSIWRLHPFGAVIAWVLVIAGLVVAITGAMPLLPEPRQPIKLPDGFDLRWMGYGLVAIGLFQLLCWWLATLVDQLEIYEHELVWTHGLLSKEYTEINMLSVRTVTSQ
jgi:uncharacterized membrane protein YdbT with pleckstrin-like domain